MLNKNLGVASSIPLLTIAFSPIISKLSKLVIVINVVSKKFNLIVGYTVFTIISY